jgi:isopentenyl diphosphate isomerase/L-lactate dehydrogenase-like FMN-dependent dehydrogenase
MKFVLATQNPKKLKEMSAILGELGVEVVSEADLGVKIEVEETGETFAENSLLKAKAVMEATKLPAIADAVGDKMTILVDGGIRTGMDVFKALALGADAVLIGRPFVNMVYGGGAEGVQVYVNKLKAELEDTMAMCGAHKLSDIKRSMIFGY